MPCRLFLFICLIGCPIAAIPQSKVRFNNITYEEGLSQSSINCMLQDKEGIIWLGTQGGLNYYDGYNIRSFQQEPGNVRSLSDDNIQCLAENEEGRLLIGTMGGGLNVFDKETELFDRYKNTDSLPLIPDNTVWALLTDPDGIIWAGTNRGLVRIDLKNRKSATFEPDTTGINGYILVLSLCWDESGKRIWMGTSNGLYSFDPADGTISAIPGFDKIPLSKRSVWKIAQDLKGIIRMGTDSGFISFDPGAKVKDLVTTRIPGSADQVVWSVLPSTRQEIWLGTNNGLVVFNVVENSFQTFNHSESDPQSIANDLIWSLMVDRSGIIWAGTGNGLSGYDPYAVKFGNIDLSNYGCHPGDVNAILEDSQNTLWIGTSGSGLFRIQLQTGKCEVLKSGQRGLTSDQIWALMEDHLGRIWLGTYGGGLCCLPPGQNSFVSYHSHPDCPTCLSNDRIFALEEDIDGNIWIGTRNGGLCRFDPKTQLFKSFLNDPANENSIAGDVVLSLKADRSGHLWIGTYGKGLSCFDVNSETFTNFHSNSRDNRYIPDNNIWCILEDQKDRLWLGTSTGVCLIPEPLKTNRVLHLGYPEGLPKGVIMGLVQDPHQNLWMSSFSGLSKMNMDSLEKYLREPDHLSGALFRNYSTDEGLQSNGFGQGAYFISDMGYLYFGGINGVNRFRADQVQDNAYFPDIRITKFKILNQDVLIDSQLPDDNTECTVVEREGKYYTSKKIPYVKSLKISSKIKVIFFEFSSLHYSRPRNNLYAYKLENFDHDWNYTGTKHDATYTNLPPGNYVLKVKGTNSDGIWNPDPATLSVIITPMFHQTTLFFILLVILILSILFSILFYIIRTHRNRSRKDKEFAELQLKAIKNQIDPHFTFNVINTVAGMVYKGNPDRTYDYFSRFAKLIRTSLENSDRLKVTLSEEIDFVKNYLELEKARFSDDLEYSFHISPDVRLDAEVPKMIIQIFAENAMKHGLRNKKDDKRLFIRIYTIDKSLIIEIEDNGIGRAEAARMPDHSTGKGYEIIIKLTDLYHQLYDKMISFNVVDLYHDDHTSAGTRVDVIIR
jgi:ligand-binding sensor domain-containing protein